MAAGALALGACGGSDSDAYGDGSAYFPQSVASGDPKESTVVLWTRVEDPDAPAGEDIELEVEVSKSEDFSDRVTEPVTARAARDYTVRVRLTELEAGTVYYYRFVHHRSDGSVVSRVGRTKTAPPAGEDAVIRFVFVSCQDFIGRYYNNYRAIAEEDIDFIVHLGDYIYETSGDPSFQQEAGDRTITFEDEAGAIPFNAGTEDEYFAAASLSNYRQLYRVNRGDPSLQLAHERFAMINTWDDHEFSNDCYGANGTYFSGAVDEEDVDRRKAANQAWAEYMPIDHPEDPDFEYDPSAAFPGDLRIYRDLRFGQNMHLMMTDARTWRTDHPIPEGALPGAVPILESDLMEVYGEVSEVATPYVPDIDAVDAGAYATAIKNGAATLEIDAALVTGPLNVGWVNDQIEALGDTGLSPIDPTGLPRGISYADMGKSSQYSSFGSRSLVVKDSYDLFTEVKWVQSQGASQQVLGEAQDAWLFETVENTDAVWKVWGNEFPINQYAVDLTKLGGIPEAFTKRFYLTVDQWEGQRNRRSAVLERLAAAGNVVAVTGDMHAFGAGTPPTNDGMAKIVEIMTSSISTPHFKDELLSQIASNPSLSNFSAATTLATAADDVLALGTNPFLSYTNTGMHGYTLVEVRSDAIEFTMKILDKAYVLEDYGDRIEELQAAYKEERFRVEAGSPELYRDFDGTWKRWDPQQLSWV